MPDRQSPARNDPCRTARLRVFGTSDLHVHLLPYDYYTDRPAPAVGLSQVIALVEAMRAGHPNSLLLDNGDFLQGTPLSDYIAEETGFERGDLHPVIAAMNAAGYDAATLGNHEFNYGLSFLDDALLRTGFPVVSANILTGPDGTGTPDRTYLPPWTILDRIMRMEDGTEAPIRIGVIGFAPPQTAMWDRSLLHDRIGTRDIVAAARQEVPALRAAGADIVVALCHSGIGGTEPVPGMENAAIPLAALGGIDVMVTGHIHKVFPGPGFTRTEAVDPVAGTLHGVPTVMPGFHGSHLGVIDLDLVLDRDGWSVRGHQVRAEPLAERRNRAPARARVQPDPRIVETAQEAHDGALGYLRRPVGQTLAPLTSYFVLVAPNPTLRLLADAQRRFAERLLAGTPMAEAPLIVAVSPFKAGGWGGPGHYVDIPAGPLTLRNAAELYLFPNTLCALELTGAQAADWLERSAGLFRQIAPGSRDTPLTDPDFAAYNFDILDGLSYRIDLSRPARYAPDGALLDPAARRIVEIGYRGRPLDPAERLVVVTNSYRAGGGGLFRAAAGARQVFSTSVSARDILVDHIRSLGVVTPAVRATWDFVPMPRTSTIFETGPGALRHPVADFDPIGPGEGGFERFAMTL